MKWVKKIQKVLKEGTVDDALEGLEVQLPPFLEHVFIKQQQARFFKDKLEHLTEEEAVVQVDFGKITTASTRGKFSLHIGAKTKYLVHCCNLDKVMMNWTILSSYF